MSEDIHIKEGEAPLLTFYCKELLPDGTKLPYVLTGNDEIRFTTKANRDDTAAEFEYTKTGGKINIVGAGASPGDEYSEVTVQMDATDTTDPVSLWYKLVAVNDLRIDVLKNGLLVIENV